MATAEKEVVKEAGPGKPFTASHPFLKLCANRVKVVVQQKGGNVIRGTAKWFRMGYLKLTDVEIVGSQNKTKTPWILIENHAIAHLHPASAPVEEIKQSVKSAMENDLVK